MTCQLFLLAHAKCCQHIIEGCPNQQISCCQHGSTASPLRKAPGYVVVMKQPQLW